MQVEKNKILSVIKIKNLLTIKAIKQGCCTLSKFQNYKESQGTLKFLFKLMEVLWFKKKSEGKFF